MIDLQQAIADDRISPLFASEVEAELTFLRNQAETMDVENGRLHVRAEAAEAEVERLRADRDLWKHSESVCSEQHDKRMAEVERLRAALERSLPHVHEWNNCSNELETFSSLCYACEALTKK